MIIPHHDRPATMPVKRKRARELAYLGNASTIAAHLKSEFGRDAKIPDAKFLEMVLFERENQQKHTAHYAARRRETHD